MAKENKPFYKMKRFWGTVITVTGILLKIIFPQSAAAVDQITPILQPVIENMDMLTDSAIVGGAGLVGAGWLHKKIRDKNKV